MRASWRDPDDVVPDARRKPREIAGWRTGCSLRRMMGHPASGITVAHIMAADKLRELVDVARLGFSGERPLIYVQQATQPRWGLGPAAVKQMQAYRAVRRIAEIFPERQLAMLDMVVLRNATLRSWAMAHEPPLTQAVEKGRLLGVLDRLVLHFGREVEDDLARGKRLQL